MYNAESVHEGSHFRAGRERHGARTNCRRRININHRRRGGRARHGERYDRNSCTETGRRRALRPVRIQSSDRYGKVLGTLERPAWIQTLDDRRRNSYGEAVYEARYFGSGRQSDRACVIAAAGSIFNTAVALVGLATVSDATANPNAETSLGGPLSKMSERTCNSDCEVLLTLLSRSRTKRGDEECTRGHVKHVGERHHFRARLTLSVRVPAVAATSAVICAETLVGLDTVTPVTVMPAPRSISVVPCTK